MVKNILDTKLEGRRKVGKSRLTGDSEKKI